MESPGEYEIGTIRRLFLCGLIVLSSAASHAETAIIVNNGLTYGEVSRAMMRGIFGMRVRVWPDGTPVQVFVLDDAAPAHGEFCRSILRMYPYQLRQNWDRLVYSGTGQPPIKVGDASEMHHRVAATRGGVGYTADPADAPFDGLKVLDVR